MFKRNRKAAAPQISMITRDWNNSIRSIEWTDGALVSATDLGLVASDWGTPVTEAHWTQVWETVSAQ